jgi:hypothetical protein
VSGRVPLVARCTRFNLMFLYLLKTGVGYTVSSPDRQVIHKKCVNHLCTVLTIYWNIHIWHTTVFFIGFMALKTYTYVLSRPYQDHRLFHITIIINKTTFASRILLFLLKIIQDYESVFFTTMLRTQFYVKVVLWIRILKTRACPHRVNNREGLDP